jgi:hypothetical protein
MEDLKKLCHRRINNSRALTFWQKAIGRAKLDRVIAHAAAVLGD